MPTRREGIKRGGMPFLGAAGIVVVFLLLLLVVVIIVINTMLISIISFFFVFIPTPTFLVILTSMILCICI